MTVVAAGDGHIVARRLLYRQSITWAGKREIVYNDIGGQLDFCWASRVQVWRGTRTPRCASAFWQLNSWRRYALE